MTLRMKMFRRLVRPALGGATGFVLAAGAAMLAGGAGAGPAERGLVELTFPAPLPAHYDERVWRTLDNTPADNPTTEAGAVLGRALFYDRRLSQSGSTSCGTCHEQGRAFTDGRPVSVGHGGALLDRNAMSLVDLRFSRAGFFWDERAPTIEDAIRAALYSRSEMGHTRESVVAGVRADPRYGPMFAAAFGSAEVDEGKIVRAIGQFVRTLTSTRSRYDQAAADAHQAGLGFQDDFPRFTPIENRGKALYIERCNLCHHIGESEFASFFGMFRTLRNGINADGSERDGGLGDVSFAPGDVGSYKASSLKNVAVTGPYMHDGRLATLADVIDHYARTPGIEPSSRFPYTPEDKRALIAFLETLTDEPFLTDPRFADPWPQSGAGTVPTAPMAGQPRPPTPPEPDLTPTERIAQGLGLRAGEVGPWLKTLDTDGDGSLSRAELQPVVDVLVSTGVAALDTGNGGRRARRGLAPPPPAATTARPTAPTTAPQAKPASADFNGDGQVDDRESRMAAALARQVELGDGGRLEVILDRMLARWNLPLPQLLEARHAIREEKARQTAALAELDNRTLAELRKLIPPAQWTDFEYAVIELPTPAPEEELSEPEQLARAVRNVMQFDTNGDGALDGPETAALQRALEAVGQGFGRTRARREPGALTRAFVDRLFRDYAADGSAVIAARDLPERMATLAAEADADGSRTLTRDELETYIRRTAFARAVRTGIYIGGGFADTIVNRSAALRRLDSPAATRAELDRLLSEHRRQVEEINTKAVRDTFARVSEALRK